MTQSPSPNRDALPWYRQKVFWLLMSGPMIVVVAAFASFYFASSTADDMVSDDYYKDGKHINLQIERDSEAAKRKITAQVLFNPQADAAKVFVSGDFPREQPLQLVLMHPAKQAFDQTVPLKAGGTSGDKAEYQATFAPLAAAAHWYVRVEDANGQWRVQSKWLPNQGGAVELKPKPAAP
ncbi:FixH family protein [Conchiformibius kuhniae]|uniref:FixH family protein n=1 Tax=Conchiformibius kuhniae TaxID=211502 RepID=A0A8T9MTD9_9NEIS|nr:FixH family protein [Conchiformibius kuhniae]UOP04867.1 FixH family protein [Conchiformibius kuhniae]